MSLCIIVYTNNCLWRYILVAWLGIVPLTAYRTYRFFFSGSLDMLVSLPFDMFSTENLAADVFRGCFVVTCTLFAFIGLVWLREQVSHASSMLEII